ncbi:NAD(P)-dependent oxidoreductase [Nocardia sp. NPDC050193]
MTTSSEERALEGRTLIISGGSRGIGAAIAVRAARQGANIALIAKTTESHPKLPGTIFTAAAAIEDGGGQALPIVGDIRDDDTVGAAVARTVEQFGGIDVNNASALDLTPTEHISMKKYDLMQDINARGAFLLTKTAIPHLRRSPNAHVLTMSPPIDLDPKWFSGIGVAYTISKFSMSLVTIGLAAELRADGIAVNSLWPRTTIATAAVRNILSEKLISRSRTPEIVADAAMSIITKPAGSATGQCLIDDEVLAREGVCDVSGYQAVPGGHNLELDFWMAWT